MAEEFIEEIYNKAQVITIIKKMEEICRKRQNIAFLAQWERFLEPMAAFCRDVTQQNEMLGVEIWNMLQDVRNKIEVADFVKTADVLENIIPYMYDAMELFGGIDVTEGEYRIFSSRSGFLNIELVKNKKAIYSENDPAWDRYKLAKSLYAPTTKHYIIVGCGLGYLPWQLYQVSDGAADIHIFDADSNMVEFARRYGVLSYIPQEHLHVTIEKDFYKMISSISDFVDKYDESEVVFYIEKYFEYYLSDDEKATLNSLNITIQTKIDFKDIVEQNYYRNRVSTPRSIYDWNFEKYNRNWIIVGGGPSFDENIDYLREQAGKKTIIAASTIWKRMLDAGVEPEIVAVIDPQERTYGHMNGVVDTKPVMILTEYANWRFAEYYMGEKYLVPCETAYYAIKNADDKIFDFRGTVTSFAIEIAAYANAQSIELIGVDLAFPGEKSHAAETMDYTTVDCSKMEKVKSVDGGMVYTDNLFKVYLADIEEQLKRHPKISFFNLSKHGALIKGCKNI